MRWDVADKPHVVYRAYSYTAALLYVGCTCDFESRMKMHKFENRWHRFCRIVTVQEFPDHASAWAAETAAIRSERPVFNLLSSGHGTGGSGEVIVRPYDPDNIPQPIAHEIGLSA